jgi:hypothetical protein
MVYLTKHIPGFVETDEELQPVPVASLADVLAVEWVAKRATSPEHRGFELRQTNSIQPLLMQMLSDGSSYVIGLFPARGGVACQVISIPFKPDVVILKPPYALRIHLLGGMSVLLDTECIEKEHEIILLATVPYSAFISKIEIVSGGYTLAAPVRWRPVNAT